MTRTLSRRQLLSVGALLTGAAACRQLPLSLGAPGTDPAARPSPPPGSDDLAIHAARRLTFGATPDDVAAVRTAGLPGWLDEQLDPTASEGPVVDQALAELPTLTMDAAELARGARAEDIEPARDVIGATVLRAAFSHRQLFELLVDFWSNHLNVYIADGPVRFLKVLDDREVVRRHALGTFRELLVASAKSPAMLVYLDNALSTGDAPNENYARELLELHTLGVDGGYDEDDVGAVARVLSGWTLPGRSGDPTFRFVPFRHDDTPQRVLDHVTPGRGGADGVRDGEELLAYLAGHPATARHLARKLATRFVSDRPSDDLVASTAQVYLDHDTAVVPTLRHVLLSDEFANSGGAKLRRPLELIAGTLRVLDAPADEPLVRRAAGQALEALGQLPFGWPAPNGYPDAAPAWLGTGALLNRWNWAQTAAGATGRGRLALAPDVASRDPGGMVDELSRRLLLVDLPPPDRDAIVAYAGDDPDAAQLTALILNSRHFQYR